MARDVSDENESEYLTRLQEAPYDVALNSLVEITEKDTDVPVGTRGYVVSEPLDNYDWPVYEIRWIDGHECDADSGHVASAFFEVIQEPIVIQSITDVEEFLNDTK